MTSIDNLTNSTKKSIPLSDISALKLEEFNCHDFN